MADDNVGHGNLHSAFGQAELIKKPKTIRDSWVEWEFGLWGNGAAQTSPHNRGVSKLYLRKFLLCLVSRMVWSGWTAQVACNEICDVYEHNTIVSKILKLI